MVNQPEPGSDVGVGKSRLKSRYSGSVSTITLYDAESGEVYCVLCELECVRVEDYPCSVDENEAINGPPPMIQQLNIPVNGVLDASILALEVGNGLIKTVVVPVTR